MAQGTFLLIPTGCPLVKRYELVEHTADLMVKAYGSTLEECYANAGYALFDQTVDLSGIRPVESVEFEISGEDPEYRLYAFLSELLFLEDCDNLILCDITVRFDGDRVICSAKGETLDRSIHRVRSEIKAVTYHMMAVDPLEPSVTVVFDV
jgi:SHS2 domain-containing protein